MTFQNYVTSLLPMRDIVWGYMEPIDVIREYLEQNSDFFEKELSYDVLLMDLGLDSFSLLELIFVCEDRFSIKIPSDIEMPVTIGDLVKLIKDLQNPKKRSEL